MHPPACRSDPAGRGRTVNGGAPLVAPLRAGLDERRQTCARCRSIGCVMISGAMPRLAWPGCLPLRWCMVWLWHRDRAPGASTGPASHGHPALREISYGADTTRISNFSPTLTVSDRTRRALDARGPVELVREHSSKTPRHSGVGQRAD